MRMHAAAQVATPGRIGALLRKRKLRLAEIAMLVLDEADLMLDMGSEAGPKARTAAMFLAARALNANGQYRATLLLREERLRAACPPRQDERCLKSAPNLFPQPATSKLVLGGKARKTVPESHQKTHTPTQRRSGVGDSRCRTQWAQIVPQYAPRLTGKDGFWVAKRC